MTSERVKETKSGLLRRNFLGVGTSDFNSPFWLYTTSRLPLRLPLQLELQLLKPTGVEPTKVRYEMGSRNSKKGKYLTPQKPRINLEVLILIRNASQSLAQSENLSSRTVSGLHSPRIQDVFLANSLDVLSQPSYRPLLRGSRDRNNQRWHRVF